MPFLFLLLATSAFATEAQKGLPLFSEEELAELAYLKSDEFLYKQHTVELKNKSQARMKAALKLYALGDRKKREAYFKQDIWALEDKRESYFALMNWLERISPLSKVKRKSKENK